MANLRNADEENIVIEMITHANMSFKEDLLKYLNQGLQGGNFNESWYIVILQMIAKVRDLGELAN